jgi:holliday junction DNA helicase RuvA
MITKMTGRLVRVLDDELRVLIGPFEYQVLVPEAVRRQVQMKVDEEVTLYINEYLEGGPNANKFIPRKIGFLREEELDFFELFCTVDKIGVKKALKALAQPIRDIANAISREDSKWLTTLPGIGATTAEQIVTTLKRKVTKYAVSSGDDSIQAKSATYSKDIDQIYQALLQLGHNPMEARNLLDSFIASGKKYENVEDAIMKIYSR